MLDLVLVLIELNIWGEISPPPQTPGNYGLKHRRQGKVNINPAFSRWDHFSSCRKHLHMQKRLGKDLEKRCAQISDARFLPTVGQEFRRKEHFLILKRKNAKLDTFGSLLTNFISNVLLIFRLFFISSNDKLSL